MNSCQVRSSLLCIHRIIFKFPHLALHKFHLFFFKLSSPSLPRDNSGYWFWYILHSFTALINSFIWLHLCSLLYLIKQDKWKSFMGYQKRSCDRLHFPKKAAPMYVHALPILWCWHYSIEIWGLSSCPLNLDRSSAASINKVCWK